MADALGAAGNATGGADPTPFEANLNIILQCKDCDGPTELIEEFSSGDLICAQCGLVVGDRIVDTRSEWRTFANDDQGGDDPSRVGDSGDPLFGDSALETKVDTARGQNASGRLIGRLNAANKKTQGDHGQRALLAGFQKITEYVDALQAGRLVLDMARHIFKLVEEAKILKGKTPEAVVAGCIFIACRRHKVGRTFREIHGLTHVTKKEIGRVFKILEEFIKKNAAEFKLIPGADDEAKGSTNAEELVERFCTRLGFAQSWLADKISKRLAQEGTLQIKELAGRSPLSVAAAAIYMMSYLIGDPRTPKDISEAAGVSDGTIKTAYRFLYAAREQLVDPTWALPPNGGMQNLPSN